MKDIRAKTYPNARLSRSTRRTTSSCPKNGRSTLVPGCRATSWRKANTGNTRNAADLTRRGRKGRRRAPARNGSAGGRLGMAVLLLVLILRERAGVPRGAELSVVVYRALQPGSTQPFGCHDDEEAAHPVSYTHLRAHETKANLVCRLLLEKKKKTKTKKKIKKNKTNKTKKNKKQINKT